MSEFESLENFYFPENILPLFHGADIESIPTRALEILRNRNLDEVNSAVKTINWMLDDKKEELIDLYIEVIENDDISYSRDSRPKQLMTYSKVFDIDNQDGFLHAKWSEYLAVNALIHFRFAQKDTQYLYVENPDLSEDAQFIRLGKISPSINDALESVVLAERLKYEGDFLKNKEEKHKEKVTLNSQQAAIKRHSLLTQYKAECINYFKSNNKLSQREAVRRFLDSLEPSIISALNLREPLRTFTKTLSQYVNGKLPTHIKLIID